MYARIENPIGNNIITALFENATDAELACEMNFHNNDNEISQFRKMHDSESSEMYARTIRIWDVPMHFTKLDIAKALSDTGPLEKITIQNANPFLSATATYCNVQDYENITQKWSIMHDAFSMRIFPYYRTREIRNDRDKYSATITQLPPNTTAGDLEHIISTTNAQTCYIPKKDTENYKRFAVLSFLSKDDLDKATSQQIGTEQQNMKWVNRDVKLCFQCSAPDHNVRDCPEAPKPQNSQQHFHTPPYPRYGYKPPHLRGPNPYLTPNNTNNFRSYADVVRPKPYQNQVNSITRDSIKEIYEAISQIRQDIATIQQQVKSLDERITLLETDNAERHFEEIEEMEEDTESTRSTETVTHEEPSESVDLREAQKQIDGKLNRMSDTMNNVLALFGALNQTQTHDKLAPPPSSSSPQ
jgi:hypothetical protein